ncbi:hypothetical protein GXP67_13410 [Rhodocytophaga rosea]|uniref:BamA/TamA family outer membrane protein n=1 Tax=Rhodocytophaga rosea TaxID=2704465 RepID=A0A6C0GIP7_9BACT|nr:hypothetical protein [Rhodocytophaga rosea]QHT67553.1 hypothetical protein GXP67_13410 [Rhodocytophaga rosea]
MLGSTATWTQAQVRGDTIRTIQDTTRNAMVVGDNELIESIEKQINEADSSRFFYEKLKRTFSKTKVTRELYRLLFREPYQNITSRTVSKMEDRYRRYNGKIIGQIDIQTLDPFGARVTDTLRRASNWFERAGNSVHVSTRNYVIRKSLLFTKGDQLNSSEISNNERILRQQLPFILDARIFVLPRIENKDTVDILVLTQDTWSISGNVGLSGLKGGSIKLDDRNIFGFGHEFQNGVSYNSDPERGWGYRGLYRVPFIGKTFITGELSYINEWNQNIYGLKLRRDFLTPTTKYAGGLEVSNTRLLRDIIPFGSDTAIIRFPFAYTLADVWLGRSFQIKKGSASFRERSRLIVAGRITSTDYNERPEVRPDTNQLYWNRMLVLASIGISNRNYFRDVLIYGFGRTEDVPYGMLVSVTAGTERNEFGNRFYAGMKFSRGKFFNNFGYLVTTIDAGSFIRNRKWEQGVLRFEANYFSRLLMLRTWRLRQFVNLRYTKGIGRFDTEFIDISSNNGIRGIGSNALRGAKSVVLNLETVFFTPINLLGFQMATFAYGDLGFITPSGTNLFAGSLFQGYGIGFRFRNENLTFNTFQIRLGFYPNIPGNNAIFRTQFSGIPSIRLSDFDIKAPDIVNFGRR